MKPRKIVGVGCPMPSVPGLHTMLLSAEKKYLIEIPGKKVVSMPGKSKPALGERLAQTGVCLAEGETVAGLCWSLQLSTGC